MILRNEAEVANTRRILREFEERLTLRSQEVPIDPRVHAHTLRSLRRTIVQLKEDIVRFESHRLLQLAAQTEKDTQSPAQTLQ